MKLILAVDANKLRIFFIKSPGLFVPVYYLRPHPLCFNSAIKIAHAIRYAFSGEIRKIAYRTNLIKRFIGNAEIYEYYHQGCTAFVRFFESSTYMH